MNRIEQNTVDFLKELAQNNNREWFNQNKERYLLAKQNFDAFVQDLLNYLSSIDPSLATLQVKDTVYRIYRDIRFTKIKRLTKHTLEPILSKMEEEHRPSQGTIFIWESMILSSEADSITLSRNT